MAWTHSLRIGLVLAAALAAACVGNVAAEARPVQVQDEAGEAAVRPGLMWNRSGLPAVFPLLVKTLPGADYYLTLSDPETDKAVLAAYVVGGRQFRVLVPPGTYTLSFATGVRWQGEARLFGPGEATRFIEIDEPLTFKVEGIGRKRGHVVDLRGETPGVMAEVESRSICQTASLESLAPWQRARLRSLEALRPDVPEDADPYDRFRRVDPELASRVRRIDRLPRYDTLSYEMRSRLCD